VNGWKTPSAQYLQDVNKAAPLIESLLFRPPYGRIRKSQTKGLDAAMQKQNVKVVMWDVLSADFDTSVSPETCAGIVLQHSEPGSIIVFHDSEKAFPNLQFALPRVLEKLTAEGYSFQKLTAGA
jgi:peptidoglycan/xylan/chitin deacetylase (PgdA/CDA1 family)